jgi:spore germination protein YaaH
LGDLPVTAGQTRTITVHPYVVDLWLGRAYLVDSEGAKIVYYSDAESLSHWRDKAHFDWGLRGIAIWTLGQEDTRFWHCGESIKSSRPQWTRK